MKKIDIQTMGTDWRLVHTDEARWSPMPEHEYSVSFHAAGGVWVTAYFAPGAETGEWLEGAGPSDSRHTLAFKAAEAARTHWADLTKLRVVNPITDAKARLLAY